MKIDIKRKRKGKTDYKARFNMLKSEIPRVVIRKTNRYMIVQYVKSKEAQDSVIVTTSSKDLLKNGWDKKFAGSLKSIPAAYLTGFIAGKKILSNDKKAQAILDLGLQRNVAGSRIYAVLSGLNDSGLKIKTDEKVFPKKDRLEGKHLKKELHGIVEKLKGGLK